VPGLYLDTSALGRVLLAEPDARAVLTAMGGFERLVSSRLLALELRRLAMRRGRAAQAEAMLAGVALLEVGERVMSEADTIPPASVRSLDAIHLATAVRCARSGAVEAVLTFDHHLAEGAREHGLEVLAPN